MVSLLTGLLLFFAYRASSTAPTPYSRQPRNPLVVRLPKYGTFHGTQILTTLNSIPLDEAVDAWLGIDYATQPVGESRFAPVTWPPPFQGIWDSSQYGPVCIQNPTGTPNAQSEACLNLNVYRTTSVPLSKKLPVLAWIHGGSFVGGSGRSFDGAAFVAASSVPIMAVTFQYRLGALGSLPSALFEEAGILNLGLQDQRMFLEFIKYYISQFGGDPDAITLGGQSAGGHSVGIHYFHNYGADAGKPLFSQVILSSGSPTARAFPNATYPLYRRQFSQFMAALNCPESPNDTALACLRAVDISLIQSAQARLYSSSEYNITWPFQPVSPGPTFEKRASQSGEDGTFFPLPLLISSTTDEGKGFTPRNLTTNSDYLHFLANLAPGLTQPDLEDLNRLYPDPALGPGLSPYTKSLNSTQYNRISATYGDYSYICPIQESAYRISSAGLSVYKARFNTPNNAKPWQGIPHASDSKYFNGLPDAQFPDVAELYHSYYVSFVATGDPNTHAIEGAPYWEAYGGLGGGELVIGNMGRRGTYMEREREGIRMEQCAWWRDPERMARLNK
ncbi:alpha/beta-hydrolase [Lindgomyces ingoldianus]|uniref:Alpha/beta-hydrolase n=1 Tax=Lindgomyces ingoldianus TaxID=673940 RepID=A0ACB6QFK0_9PLEO|nr:alpha/beta-hydrolase [Lindgomyces ingoldianus]KAF2465671.1 alpha/beta-hydrolase [Lindgomyces ingoldianus]